MFNPQNYEKMKTETAKRIRKFVQEIEIPQSKYYILYYEDNFVVLRNEQFENLYIINGKIYKEMVSVYPIFSLDEIKEALEQF